MADGGAPEFPKRLYTLNEDPIPLKSIGHYSNNKLLFDALHEALEEDEWAELEESRLGVFLKFNRLRFGWASRLVHFVLCLQLECKKKYELWSLIGVTPIRFSLNEFEEYTGLNCSYIDDLEEPEGDVEVTEEMTDFWGKLGLSVETGPSIEDLTNACAFAAEWSREDRLRLGYLAIYAGFIEARTTAAPVRLNLARMVMDLDSFENYPWGRLAFLNLIESVKTRDLCKAYTLEGFVQILQIWIYKAMPDFATSYGQPIPGGPTPALLAFRGSRGRKYVRSKMLKQSRFRAMVMKGRDSINPVWDDDEEDMLVENIISAYYQELSKGPWRWQKKHWRVEGVLMNTQAPKLRMEYNMESKGSMDSDNASRKRAKQSTSTSTEQSDSFVSTITNHIELCIRSISTEIILGFDKCEMEIKNLADKVESMEQQLAVLVSGQGEKVRAEDAEQVKSNGADPPPQVSNPSPSPKDSDKKASPKPTKKTRGRKKKVP